MHSASDNLASNYERNIILPPLESQYPPPSHCVRITSSEFATYASFSGGGSQIGNIFLEIRKSVLSSKKGIDKASLLIL